MKKIGSVILVLALVLMLGIPALANEAEVYPVWVGGVQVTAGNAQDVLGDGTVSYDAESNTLTLNGAEITGGYEQEEGSVAAIYAAGDLNIALIGTNSVTAPDASASSNGIRADGDLSISGDGNIVCNGGAVTAQDGVAVSFGIWLTGSLAVYEVSVTANGGSAIVSGDGTAVSSGVYIEGDLEADFGGTLIALGGKAQATQAYSFGIASTRDNDNYVNISLYEGSVTAEGADANGISYAQTAGVYIYNGGFYMYEAQARAHITAGNAVVSADGNACSNGIHVRMGDVGISDGILNVYGGSCTAESGNVYAVYIEAGIVEEGGYTYTMGGYFSAECDEVQPGTFSPALVGTTVNIYSTDGKAIYAQSGIDIGSKLTISVPENGVAGGIGGSMDPENWSEPDYWTILDGNGDSAQNVTIEPLAYEVSIQGLSYGLAVPVPAGQSVNDTYCERFEIDDFSEYLHTEKEGYTFGGWYTDEACTDGNEFRFDMPVTENITIYAKWVAVSDTPPTSDSSPVAAMLALLLCSGGAILATVTNKKRVAQ